jgi:hypothetical protein
VYNHWKSAKAVPIPIRSDAIFLAGTEGSATLDVEYWISKPPEIVSRTWVRVCKEYKTCAVYYYTSLPASLDGMPGLIPHGDMRVEDVGDVLYVKLVDRQVVNIDDEEIKHVLHNIVQYL